MTIDIHADDVVSAHNPALIQLEFLGELKKDDELNIIVKSAYLTKREVFLKQKMQEYTRRFSLDIKAITCSMFEPQSINRNDIMKEITIEVFISREQESISFNSKKIKVINSTEEYVEFVLRRLGHNGRETENLTFFKGYPQYDLFFIEAGLPDNRYNTTTMLNRNSKALIQDNHHYHPEHFIFRKVDECGIFLRWRNDYGGWSYWLFSDLYTEEIKTKSLGRNDNTAGNFGQDIKLSHFGYEVKKTWILESKVPVFDKELPDIQTLFYSPEVYLFIGEKRESYDNNEIGFSPQDWQRVSIAEQSHKIKKNGHATYNISVTIEFREQETIKYI